MYGLLKIINDNNGKERIKVHKYGQAGGSIYNEEGTSSSKATIYVLGELMSFSVS